MQRIDRTIGVVLALLAAAVLWTARSFPAVPGQKVGAGFLPLIVGTGLLVCGVLLVRRSFDAARYQANGASAAVRAAPVERWRSAGVVLGAILAYLLLADRMGFLVVAPVVLVAVTRSFGLGWRAAVVWSLVGALVVHLAFYKLLRVPLPWGVLRPLY